MAITLADVEKVTLRQIFLPWFIETSRSYGIPVPADWNPSDAQLARLAEALSRSLHDDEEEG